MHQGITFFVEACSNTGLFIETGIGGLAGFRSSEPL